MVRLRGLVLLTLLLPGAARRALRTDDSHHDAKRQNNTIARALQVSVEARAALFPGSLGKRMSTVWRAGAWRQSGPRHATVVLQQKPQDMSEEDRRAYLGQLFGESAAQKLEPPPSVSATPDIAMLQDGMQALQWGQTRLVDVDMAVGPLELSLAPLLTGSSLYVERLEMPLGMVLEEHAPVPSKAVVAPLVTELLEGGSALEGGVRVGDLLRATTYMTMGYKYETWKMMLGGGGTPALQKALMPTDNQPFEQVLAAIASNSRNERGNGQIVLLVERPAQSSSE